ncbi:DUF3619 family protein [Tahibacter amnicola]|uniref:DUF3619 family protein n=1 Tax=Tahibacter amnicola TaxID=2976241 RepID=A0ABY6BGZ7_9GAMM|nr:DUF3619 family protein [Tahibacter amnicola]UXI69120.1 DUF3619 family protein [Tahibacter amnicola]
MKPDNATDQIRRLLDDSVDGLDAATLSRLNRARQRALAAPPRQNAWMPMGLAAAASLVLAVALLWQREPVHPLAPAASTASPVLDVPEEEALEFVDDLEFYAWLEAEAEQNG